MASQQVTSVLTHSSRPASKTGLNRNVIHPSYNELLSQIPKEGRDFVTSLCFYNSMSEAVSRARAEGSITVDIKNEQAVREFSRFLALKIYTTDTIADKISPTALMDAVWHQLILDTQVYEKLQETIEFKLHHRPSGAHENEARKVRLVIMESLYLRFFEEKPLRPANDACAAGNLLESSSGPVNRASAVSEKQGKKAKSNLQAHVIPNSTTIHMRTLTGTIVTASVDNDTPNGWAYIMQEKEGIPSCQIRSIWNGRDLQEHETIRSSGLGEGDIVWITLKLRGC